MTQGPEMRRNEAGRNIRIDLEYDGAHYHGFQRQPGRMSIQQVLEEALSKLFDRDMKIKAASGRTDTGVHAFGQVVNFFCDTKMTPARIQKGLNAWLPPDISVTTAGEVPADFHARFSAKSKFYEYRIWNAPYRSPLLGERAWHVATPLDLAKMRRAMKLLAGRHDFRSFEAADPARALKGGRNTVRTITCFSLKRSGKLLRIQVEADGFLYHMVRNLAGILVEVGMGKLDPGALEGILKARDRRKAGRMAPAAGLFLVRVDY